MYNVHVQYNTLGTICLFVTYVHVYTFTYICGKSVNNHVYIPSVKIHIHVHVYSLSDYISLTVDQRLLNHHYGGYNTLY